MSLTLHLDIMERVNHFQDPRSRGPSDAPVLYLEDGTELPLPTTWEVCDVCRGEGSHVNASIDCNGLSAEDFARDPDFEEDYRAGAYDVQCTCCQGRTTVKVVDWDRLTHDQAAAYRRQLDEEARDRAEQLAEIRAGA